MSTIGVEEGCDFIFQDQGQDQDLFVLGAGETVDEATIHFGNVSRSDDTILIGVADRAGHLERKIFDGFVFTKTTPLPSGCGSGLDHEERDACCVGATGIE